MYFPTTVYTTSCSHVILLIMMLPAVCSIPDFKGCLRHGAGCPSSVDESSCVAMAPMIGSCQSLLATLYPVASDMAGTWRGGGMADGHPVPSFGWAGKWMG